MKFQFAEIMAATTSTVAMNPSTANAALERRIVRIKGSSGSVAGSDMGGMKKVPRRFVNLLVP